MFFLHYQFSKPLELVLTKVTGTLITLLGSVLDENKLQNQNQSRDFLLRPEEQYPV